MTMTTTPMLANILRALCVAGLSACDRTDKPATEVPAATPAGDCLHSEGCCGGHTAGDSSCGATKTEGKQADAGDGPQQFAWTIEPGKFAEINVELGEGATMFARFVSDAPMSWNVHSHPGDTPRIHAAGNDATGTPTWVAEPGGLYSYLWVNEGTKAVKLTVQLRIEGSGRVHSTVPASP